MGFTLKIFYSQSIVFCLPASLATFTHFIGAHYYQQNKTDESFQTIFIYSIQK